MSNALILLRILIFLSPFFLPWWCVLILILASVFYFDSYYEIILSGFLFDVLYHSANTKIGLYGFSILGCIVFVSVKQIKKRLILY